MSGRSSPMSPGVASAERALRIARISLVFALLAPTFGILAQLFRLIWRPQAASFMLRRQKITLADMRAANVHGACDLLQRLSLLQKQTWLAGGKEAA